jgi:hypothetical protein
MTTPLEKLQINKYTHNPIEKKNISVELLVAPTTEMDSFTTVNIESRKISEIINCQKNKGMNPHHKLTIGLFVTYTWLVCTFSEYIIKILCSL